MSFMGRESGATKIHTPRFTRSNIAKFQYGLTPAAVHDKSLQSIVVPLDGTSFAEHAIPLAIAIAKRAGGIVRLVRVFTPADTVANSQRPSPFDLIDSHLRVDASHYLRDVQRRIAAGMRDITIVTHLAEARNIVDGIIRTSKTADLVVMATHGRGWIGRFFMGSVGRDLLRNSEKPVIFVRGNKTPVDFSAESVPRHLAIALDGRGAPKRTLDVTGALARLTGASTTLLHVDDPGADIRFSHGTSEDYLNSVRRQLRATADVSTHVVRDATSPTKGILSFVEESDVDLLAITTREVPPALRSTAENLIHKSLAPVLVVGD